MVTSPPRVLPIRWQPPQSSWLKLCTIFTHSIPYSFTLLKKCRIKVNSHPRPSDFFPAPKTLFRPNFPHKFCKHAVKTRFFLSHNLEASPDDKSKILKKTSSAIRLWLPDLIELGRRKLYSQCDVQHNAMWLIIKNKKMVISLITKRIIVKKVPFSYSLDFLSQNKINLIVRWCAST